MENKQRNKERLKYLYVVIVFGTVPFLLWNRQCEQIVLDNCGDSPPPTDLDMDDPRLVEYVRTCKMVLPSGLPYRMSNEDTARDPKALLKDYYMGMRHYWTDAVFLAERLIPEEKRTKRFFECGASDGEFMSQTFFVEKFLGWSGLLVEADPFYFAKMAKKNRKSTQFQLCASTSTRSSSLKFIHIEKGIDLKTGNEYQYPGNGAIYEGKIAKDFQTDTTRVIDVFCVPVYTMLLAANALHLDIFFLDIEGPELEVLETIPFDKIDIAIFVIEHNNVPRKREKLEAFFTEKGYLLDDSGDNDALFIKKEYIVNTKVDISKGSFFNQVKEWYNIPPKHE